MTFRRTHHVVGVLVVAGWLAAMGRLAARQWSQRISAPDRSVGELLQSGGGDTRTYGVYHGADKIGYAASRRVPAPGGGWLFVDQAVWRMQLQGSPQSLVSETTARISDHFTLTEFKARVTTGFMDLTAEGHLDGGNLDLDFTTAGKTFHDRQAVTDAMLPALVRASVAARHPAAGANFDLPVYNPLSRQVENVDVVVEGRETLDTAIGKVDCYRMKEILRGSIETKVWVDLSGETVREVSPTGMHIEAEPREMALTLPSPDAAPDLILAAVVPVKGDLAGQVATGTVDVTLHGIDPAEFPMLAGGRQKIEGARLTVTVPAPGGYPLPYVGGDQAKELASEPLVQSDDPDIVRTARKIVGGTTDAVEAARRLNDWVHDNLRKENSASVPSAVEVLKDRSGDCNEHTTLYVALARAVGLPARMAVGLVWANARGGGPGLYYHAWPEVYLGRSGDSAFGGAETSPGWYAVDPTLGQFPADAGHLRFLVGGLDQQVDLLKLIGKIQVETAS